MRKRKKYRQIPKTGNLMKKLEDATHRVEQLLIEIEKIKRFKPILQPDNSRRESWGSVREKIKFGEREKQI